MPTHRLAERPETVSGPGKGRARWRRGGRWPCDDGRSEPGQDVFDVCSTGQPGRPHECSSRGWAGWGCCWPGPPGRLRVPRCSGAHAGGAAAAPESPPVASSIAVPFTGPLGLAELERIANDLVPRGARPGAGRDRMARRRGGTRVAPACGVLARRRGNRRRGRAAPDDGASLLHGRLRWRRVQRDRVRHAGGAGRGDVPPRHDVRLASGVAPGPRHRRRGAGGHERVP